MNIQETYNAFFNALNGKLVEAEDPSNLYQCMDLAFKWIDALSVPRETIRHLYAYQIWTQPLDATVQYFELVPNTPVGTPKVGDLVIFSNVVGTAGHVSVANGTSSISSFQSFDQNWGSVKTCRLVTHSYDGVLGWLRYRQAIVDTSALQQQITTLQGKIDAAKAALA